MKRQAVASPIVAVQPKTDDLTLVRKAQKGNTAAFEELHARYKNRVFAISLAVSKNMADAEDASQEAFLQVHRHISDFKGNSAFGTWIHRVAINTTLMQMRKKKHDHLLTSLDASPENVDAAYENIFGRDDPSLQRDVFLRERIQEAIEQLPEKLRKAFVLHEIEGHAYKKVARDLRQKSVSNTKSMIHRAKLKMREPLLRSFMYYSRKRAVL